MALRLKTLLQLAKLRQAELARHLEVSTATVAQLLNHGQWPKHRSRLDLETAILAWMDAHGVDGAVRDVFEMEPDRTNDPAPDSHEAQVNNEGEDMLLDPQPLSQRARERFGLRRNPFEHELEGPDDVFLTPHMRERLLDMESAVLNKRFIAIYGESGSGKSTLRLLLQSRVEGRAHIINPLTSVGMAESDKKGITLRIDDIYRAIADSIDPSAPLKRSREARARQIRDMLMGASAPCCLVVEEAHRMPTVTLQSLKSLRETNNGWGATLGVLLVGHQELDARLSRPQLREVGQRAERCAMQPLGKHLPEYLAHRFARVGADVTNVFDADAVGGIHQRMTTRQVVRQAGVEREIPISTAYPLAVGNTVVSILNFAASLGAPRVTAEIVREWNHGAR